MCNILKFFAKKTKDRFFWALVCVLFSWIATFRFCRKSSNVLLWFMTRLTINGQQVFDFVGKQAVRTSRHGSVGHPLGCLVSSFHS